MCRLGGIVINKKVVSEDRAIEITEGLLMLLVNMEEAYGGDGNGISVHYPNGEYYMLKDHREANYFFRYFETITESILNGAHIIQLHSRLSTGGSSLNHDNLHPFTHNGVVGAHNGTIEDRFLWDELKPLGVEPYSEVDSEAIIASMGTFANNLHPKMVQGVVSDLYGMFALTLWSKVKADQLLLIRQDNPLSLWNNEEQGEVWYASTGDLLPESLDIETVKVKSFSNYGKNKGKAYMKDVRNIRDINAGEAVYIRSGNDRVTLEFTEFDIEGTNYSYYGRGSYGSYYGGYNDYDFLEEEDFLAELDADAMYYPEEDDETKM